MIFLLESVMIVRKDELKGLTHMIKHRDHFHGSDLEKIEQVYGINKEDIISFSANVNPLGVSFLLKETLANKIDAITTYPDREYTSLRQSISSYVNADMNHIIVGNGSTELISLFIQIQKPKKALLIGPTYSEYEREITLNGGRITYYRLEEEHDFVIDVNDFKANLGSDTDLLIICNPNNPTSSVITHNDMRAILDDCKQRGIDVLIDETYVEFAPNINDITAIPFTEYYSNLFIIRGISKFFAAPGLRLGYGICGNEDLLKEINKRKNPWTINSLACIAGEIMFSDQTYIEKTRLLIQEERNRISKKLRNLQHIKIYEPSANFVLVRILKDDITSQDIFDSAIKKNLMIRDCSTFPFLDDHYIRFCFMLPEQNDQLLHVLEELLN